MLTATLSRGSTSVDIPIVEEENTPLITISNGKPELQIRKTQEALDPLFQDRYSQLQQFDIQGRFFGQGAFADAITLTDMIKTGDPDTALTLDAPLPEIPTDVMVAPSVGSDQALDVAYNPGRRNWVELDLGLTRISKLQGSIDQQAQTPTASGSGPITLSDGTATVEIDTGVQVNRSVGRPNSNASRTPNARFPRYVEKPKTASDSLSLSFRDISTDVTDTQALINMISQQLGTTPLTLDFNGLFNFGSFEVVPDGSAAFRTQRLSGFADTSNVPALDLRVVRAL